MEQISPMEIKSMIRDDCGENGKRLESIHNL